MTLQDNVTLLDPFIHTKQNREKIEGFDFIGENSTTETERVTIDETYCTLITVGGKFLEKKAFEMVLKKVDEIRRIFRILQICNQYSIFINMPCTFFIIKDNF